MTRRRRSVAAVLAVLLVALAPTASAADPMPDVHLGTPEAPIVTLVDGLSLPVGADYPASVTYTDDSMTWDTSQTATYTKNVTVPSDGGGGWYVNLNYSDVPVEIVVEGYDADTGTWVNLDNRTLDPYGQRAQVAVSDTNASGASGYAEYETLRISVSNAEADPNGALDLYALGALGDTHPPDASLLGPENGSTVDEDVSVSVSVSDGDFAESWGESVNVTLLVDGVPQESATATAGDKTVSLTGQVPPGARTLAARLDDSNGNVRVVEGPTVVRPGLINVSELAADGSVSDLGGEVDVRLEPVGNVTDVTTISGTGGTVSLAGVNRSRDYVATVDVETGVTNYPVRRILLTNLLAERHVYVLDPSVDRVQTRFILDDVSGEFPPAESRIRLFRVVTTAGGEPELVPVASGYFGASAEFSVPLAEGTRYRVRVRDGEGNTRTLGGYVATAPRTVTLDLGRVEYELPANESRYVTARVYNLTASNPDPFGYVEVTYVDERVVTDALRVRITERGNASNVELDETYPGAFGTFVLNESLAGTELTATTWRVNVTAYRDDAVVFATSFVVSGGTRYPVTQPFDSKWLPVAVVTALLFTGFLFGGRLSYVGALAVGGVAAVLWWAGWHAAGGGVVLLGLVVAVLFAIGDGGRR